MATRGIFHERVAVAYVSLFSLFASAHYRLKRKLGAEENLATKEEPRSWRSSPPSAFFAKSARFSTFLTKRVIVAYQSPRVNRQVAA